MVGGFREELAGAQFDLLRVLNHASRFADLHIHSIIGRFLARPELTLLSHLLHSLLPLDCPVLSKNMSILSLHLFALYSLMRKAFRKLKRIARSFRLLKGRHNL